ncbi:MAG: hypothetical protein LBS19_14455 [Clostridiales bacterium]|jgi:hypothetical protein|nr:hypothetical protein [Clostridiales bacterium]
MRATMTPEEMKNVDIRSVDPDDLVDIRNVQISSEQSKDERIREFVRQVGNPYCYRVGPIAVKVRYADSGATLDDRLESLLTRA